jgi:hypothetical protein
MRDTPFFRRPVLMLSAIILIAALIAGCAAPATPEPVLTAVLSELSGTVLERDPSQSDFFAAANNQVIVAGAQVKTLKDGHARLDISNHAIMRLGPNTIFTLLGAVQRSNSLLANIQLAAGQLWVVLMGGYIQIETPQGLAAVRGSYLSVTVLPAVGTYVTCLEGDCAVENASGAMALIAGETGTITSSAQAPASGRMNVQDFDSWLSNVPEAASILPIARWTQTALPVVTAGPSATPFGATAQPTLTFTPTITASPTTTATSTVTATNTPLPFIFFFRPTTYVATVAFTPTTKAKPKATSTPTPTAIADHSTFFSGQSGPTGSVSECCDDHYKVHVNDLDGVSQVWVYAQVNSGPFNAYALDNTSGDKWEDDVPITANTGDTVTYKFKAVDGLGNLTIDTVINSYTLTVDCP